MVATSKKWLQPAEMVAASPAWLQPAKVVAASPAWLLPAGSLLPVPRGHPRSRCTRGLDILPWL